MANNTRREREEELFDIIRSPHRLDDLNEDDNSQYLNNTGEGDEKIFDLDDQADEVMNYDYDYDDTDNVCDDTDNVDLQITKTTDEVYLYKQASGDHHMFFYFNIYERIDLPSFSPPDQANLLLQTTGQSEAREKS